ncbi:MAG TPA: AAA family ATPase, partial [Gemmiger qucibialis]|nr:AAA family ATPase [Gemmiger qucibialis]
EFSMVDMWLAQQFFKRISQHTRVVLVGDPNQLPSVGAGNVFYELIHSGMVPVTVLDWIFRQSKDGLIAYNAKFINEGSTKLYYGNDFVFVDSPTQIESAKRIQDIYCKEAAERGIGFVEAAATQAEVVLRTAVAGEGTVHPRPTRPVHAERT